MTHFNKNRFHCILLDIWNLRDKVQICNLYINMLKTPHSFHIILNKLSKLYFQFLWKIKVDILVGKMFDIDIFLHNKMCMNLNRLLYMFNIKFRMAMDHKRSLGYYQCDCSDRCRNNLIYIKMIQINMIHIYQLILDNLNIHRTNFHILKI